MTQEDTITEVAMLDQNLLIVFGDGSYAVLSGTTIRHWVEDGNRLMGPPSED